MPLYKRVLEDVRRELNRCVALDKSKASYSVKLQNVLERMAKEIELNKTASLSPQEKSENLSIGVCLQGIVEDMGGTLKHYYIPDDSLEDWLSEIPVKDFSGIADTNKRIVSYAIHTHRNGYYVSKITRDDNSVMLVIHNTKGETLLIADDPLKKHKKSAFDGELPDCFKFVANFIHYMNCFPEMVSDGVPNDIPKKCINEYKNVKGEQLVIGTADKIKHRESHGNTTSYYRCGYFRHFPSDSTWYKNMRGKTVWIHATVCNGKDRTKTVNNIE